MSELLKNIIRFILFIFVQVFILFKMPPLHRFITPYLYYLYILWLPFSMSRAGLMALAFLFGLTLDYFMHTPGIACRGLCTDRLSKAFCSQYADFAGRSG